MSYFYTEINGYKAKDISYETACKLFKYDQENGVLISINTFHKKFEGKELGHVRKEGYKTVKYLRKDFMVHRIIWVMHHKEAANGRIDHIDGNKLNNKISNLRIVTTKQNAENIKKAHSDNKSGCLGVYWEESSQRFVAQLFSGGKRVFKKRFREKDDAALAYQQAKILFHKGYCG